MNRIRPFALSIVTAVAFVAAATAPAQADKKVRSNSRDSVNVNRNKNVNVNRTVNRDVDIDVDVDRHGGCCYHDDHHPIATAAAVPATAVVTAAVVGSIVNAVPAGCSTRGERLRLPAVRRRLVPAADVRRVHDLHRRESPTLTSGWTPYGVTALRRRPRVSQ